MASVVWTWHLPYSVNTSSANQTKVLPVLPKESPENRTSFPYTFKSSPRCSHKHPILDRTRNLSFVKTFREQNQNIGRVFCTCTSPWNQIVCISNDRSFSRFLDQLSAKMFCSLCSTGSIMFVEVGKGESKESQKVATGSMPSIQLCMRGSRWCLFGKAVSQ